jgi:hypothetical protein
MFYGEPRSGRLATLFLTLLVSTCFRAALAEGPALAVVREVEFQPLAASIRRLVESLEYLGTTLAPEDKTLIRAALEASDASTASERIQQILDKYCLFGVNINPESRVKVLQGPAKPELLEDGWRIFLVKVQNEAGVTAELQAVSPNALSPFNEEWSNTASDKYFRKTNDTEVADRRLYHS